MLRKQICFTTLLGVVLMFSPLAARAAGSACGTADTNLVTDGRVLDFDFIAVSGTGWYRFDTKANRSYSVEVRQDYDDDNTDFTTSIIASDCTTVVSATNDTSTNEPLPAANTLRRSFDTAAGGLAPGTYYIKVVNAATGGHYVSVSVSDTSMFGPQWTTFGGYITSWSFYNTTSATIHAKLVLKDYLTGNVISTVAANSSSAGGVDAGILPGKTAFLYTFSAGIAVPNNNAGNATLVHDGPPGAIVAGSFTQSPGGVLLPVKFEAVRAGHQ